MKPAVLRLLFHALREAGYEWQPQTPDRLLGFRKDPSPFRPLVQCFGLGLPVTEEELQLDGISRSIFKMLIDENFLRTTDFAASTDTVFKSAMAISGSGDLLIVHDHWPPDLNRSGGYVHYAAESAWLARTCSRDLEGFIGKRVLDLGCSSGALALEVGGVADEVLGLDISERSIEWARITAAANGFKNLRFEVAAVGESSAEDAATGKPWDCVVMNPPMVVPAKDASYAHRDGGKLGIELPLTFLDFSARHLRQGGEVLTLVTNPIMSGRGAFFERFEANLWEVIEKRCLHSHFNQEVARKQGYAEQGIERIELYFLHLRRLS